MRITENGVGQQHHCKRIQCVLLGQIVDSRVYVSRAWVVSYRSRKLIRIRLYLGLARFLFPVLKYLCVGFLVYVIGLVFLFLERDG
jgi:hypothetical protein